MSKYVPDVLSKRWVIVSPQRTQRPNGDFQKKKKKSCPFCPGHEDETGPEVMRFGKGQPDKPGWQVRVISNKFPISDFHEVIIHSPHEKRDFQDLPLAQVELILKAYVARYNFYKKKGQVLIFCNHGEHAGASIKHPHSQLVVVPFQINLDTLIREPLNNLVEENTYFNVYCPDFSQWPFEVWIAPKEDKTVFGDINEDEIKDLAHLLKKVIKRLYDIYEAHSFHQMPFGYNLYIYHKENWYIRVIPRFVHRAGFELGTGLSVNIVDPIEAALEIRGADKKMVSVLDRLKKLS